MMQDLKTDIQRLVEPLLMREGFDLVEIKLSRYRKNYRLQIFVDSDHGVTLDQCAFLSKLVGTVLDTKDVIDSRYVLELSSPGLDRPLLNQRDFKRKIGETIEVALNEEGQDRRVAGKLTGVDDDSIHLSGDDGDIKIALAIVRQGKIII